MSFGSRNEARKASVSVKASTAKAGLLLALCDKAEVGAEARGDAQDTILRGAIGTS